MARCPDGLAAGFGLPSNIANSICLIKSDFGIQNNGLKKIVTGTGVHVANRRRSSFVATAGHNIYDHDLKKLARRIECWFARRADNSMAYRNVEDAFVRDEFSSAREAIAEHDFGLLRVSSLGVDRFPGIGIEQTSAEIDLAARLTGYPDEGACSGSFKPFHVDAVLRSVGSELFDYAVVVNSYRGMSGGPLVGRRQRDMQVVAYGLHFRGPNDDNVRAIRFSSGVVNTYRDWLR
jgi:V8-like Glu-specific endopeptidase